MTKGKLPTVYYRQLLFPIVLDNGPPYKNAWLKLGVVYKLLDQFAFNYEVAAWWVQFRFNYEVTVRFMFVAIFLIYI